MAKTRNFSRAIIFGKNAFGGILISYVFLKKFQDFFISPFPRPGNSFFLFLDFQGFQDKWEP